MQESKKLLAYNRWANQRLLDAVQDLSREELGRDVTSSFPSIAATLTHMLGAEWVWLERWRGRSPTEFPEGEDLGSLAQIRGRWDGLWREQLEFLEALGPGDVERPLSYKNMKGEPDARSLADLVRHVVNHGSYHRGQLVTMLRQLGKVPPSTDYVRYLRETG